MWIRILRIFIVLAVVIAGVVLVNSFINNPRLTIQPSASYVLWEDASTHVPKGRAGNFLIAKGTVTNTHDSWSIEDVRIEVKMINNEDYEIGRRDMLVEPSYIPPGDRGDYNEEIQLPSHCDSVDLHALWEWVPPDE